MHARHDGLTIGTSTSINEAARVCLNRHHDSPTELLIDHEGVHTPASARWTAPTERELRGWADDIRATEHGAEACALAALELTQGLVAIERSRRGSGSDYVVAASAPLADDIEESMRLEISGSDHGSHAQLAYRLREKIDQLKRGRDIRPGWAVVVGFAIAEIQIAEAV